MPTGSFVPSGPFSRNTWQGIESLPGQLLNNLGRLGSYLGSPQAAQDYTNLLRGSIPGRVGSIPPSANGESYRDAELRLGNRGGSGGNAGYSTSTFIAPAPPQVREGGGAPGPGSFAPIDPYAAQNREYERERARVEAMVKANPDMQKQAIADERAKVRDQGMAIWAQKNPELAAKLQPGAVGYDAVQQALIGKNAGQASRQAFGYQTPQQITLTPPPGVNTLQRFPPVQSIQPAEAYTTEGLQLDPEMVKKFQVLHNQTKQ